METLILAVVSLLALGLWCDNWRIRKEAIEKAYHFDRVNSMTGYLSDENKRLTSEVHMLLRQKHATVPKSEVFDSRDKIPAKAPAHYVPIGRRRAQAEIASMGPVTHDAKVRENNAKAMEQAG